MECLFCEIVNGNVPGKLLYEDDYTLAFLDIHPKSAGHTLVIPKKHTTDFESISIEELKHVNKTSQLIYNAIIQSLKPVGIKVVQNNGIYQDIMHYHVHIVPGYKTDQDLTLDEVYTILKNSLN